MRHNKGAVVAAVSDTDLYVSTNKQAAVIRPCNAVNVHVLAG